MHSEPECGGESDGAASIRSVGRETLCHPCGGGNVERCFDAEWSGRLESEPRVVRGVAHDDDQQEVRLGRRAEPFAHKRRTEAMTVALRKHAHRSEHQYLASRVQARSTEGNMPDDLAVVESNQTQARHVSR